MTQTTKANLQTTDPQLIKQISDMVRAAGMLKEFSPANAQELLGASEMVDEWIVEITNISG